MKTTYIGLILVAAIFFAPSLHAQSDPLAGSWGISTSGEAALGSATNGACKVNGTVPAALYDSLFQFGHGQIIIRTLGINVGATNCTSPNFQGTGTYRVTDKGNGGFEANGKFTTSFVGRGAACSATSLTDVSFTALGKLGDNSIAVTIDGLSSGAYAEGPAAGPISCKAPILNLTASGSGKKF